MNVTVEVRIMRFRLNILPHFFALFLCGVLAVTVGCARPTEGELPETVNGRQRNPAWSMERGGGNGTVTLQGGGGD